MDVCVQPAEGRRKRLLVADMDSTIIGVECLDELADFAGVKELVSAITERAMRGEIGFEGAAEGAGRDAEGARPFRAAGLLRREGAAEPRRPRPWSGPWPPMAPAACWSPAASSSSPAGSPRPRASTTIAPTAWWRRGEALAGLVEEPILGREAKLEALRAEADALGVDLAQTLAVGDGANDLMMIKASGLGVAYRAKPVVAAEAHARVDHADLTALLYFQGYRAEEFAD